MKPVPNNVRYLASFCLILFSVLFITSSQQSCKKTSFAEATSHTDFAERFFAVKPGTNPQISRLIRILKQENERHNFLDQLPANISLPLWNKMKVVNNNYAARGDSSETGLMIIPFSTSGSYLEGILVAVPLDTGYNVKYYSSSFLYGICHKQGKNISQAENLLGLFMIMENYLFNRTDFYHVPVDLFPTNARNSTADSTKIASLINIDEGGGGGNNVVITNCSVVPSGVHHPNEEGPCDWKNECEYCSALYCVIGTPNLPELPIPGGGGGVPPPNTPPNTPPTGGGGGGNCTGCPEPPTDCRLPFYIEEPCPTNPVPPIPPYEMTLDDIRIFNEIDAEDAETDQVIGDSTNNCKGTKRTGNINFSGTKEHWLIQLDYIAKHPIGGEREYAIPQSSPLGNRGFADIVNTLTNEIFEIKPDNDEGRTQGLIEVQRYVTKANQFCPTQPGSFPPNWHQGTEYSQTVLPSGNPDQYLVTRKYADGVIVYKNVDKVNNPQPAPVPIPSSILDRFRDLVEKLKQNLNNIDEKIAEYLRLHPELITYIKQAAIGTGIAIVVGTILEDIVTLGAGIFDDWASFYLAYRIVRFAIKM